MDSGALEIHEALRAFQGGNLGTARLADEQLEASDARLTHRDAPLDFDRHLRDGVARADFDRADRGVTDALGAQRREKVALAERTGHTIDTLTTIASFVTLQPELMLLTEAAGGAAKMAAKSSIAGEAYNPAPDKKGARGSTAGTHQKGRSRKAGQEQRAIDRRLDDLKDDEQ